MNKTQQKSNPKPQHSRGGGGGRGQQQPNGNRPSAQQYGNNRVSGRGGNRGRGSTGRGGSYSGSGRHERPERKVILDLNKYNNKRIMIKFQGGREVTGVLSSFDQLNNMVLNDVIEYYTVENKVEGKTLHKTRELGTVVCRGPQVMVIAPEEGYKETPNPFVLREDTDNNQ